MKINNITSINALLYISENSCKWRALPFEFGNRHEIYVCLNRWAKKGVIDKLFRELQKQDIIRIKLEAVSLDSTTIKVHPDGTGALKNSKQAIRRSRGGNSTKIHMVAPNNKIALEFTLSEGNAHDATKGRLLLETIGELKERLFLLMDNAYEDDYTKYIAQTLNFRPVVPKKRTAQTLGNMITSYTKRGTKLNVFSVS